MAARARAGASLTTAGLKGFVPPLSAETVWDTEPDPKSGRPPLPGLGLRTRGRSDPATWVWTFKYRHGETGEQVKVTLGRYLTTPPETARKEAEKYSAARKLQGADLWEKRARARKEAKAAKEASQRAEEAEAARPTMARLWERYWASEGQHKKSAASYEQLWKGHLKPAFGEAKVADITPEDVADFKVERHATPGACNRALAVLSLLFTRAATWGWRKGCSPENPAAGRAVARYPENRNEAYYTEEQLGRILEAAGTYASRTKVREQVTRGSPPVEERSEGPGLAVLLLAYTGARKGEVLSAQLSQFTDLPDGKMLWTVPGALTKNGRPVTRVLNAEVATRIRAWVPKAGELLKGAKVLGLNAPQWLFPQAAHPDKHVRSLQKAWEDICKTAGVSGGLHQLRHSVAAHMRRRGKSLSDIQQQLGHASLHTTQRYAHIMPEGVVENGDLVGEIMGAAIEAARARKPAEVIPMRGA